MELHVAIVDDDEQDREELRGDVRGWGDVRPGALGSIQCFPGGADMLAAFGSGAFSLAFLDVYMGSPDGIETARRLRDTDARLMIVFVTSSRDHAFDAFPIHPFDYVVKPWSASRIMEVLDEALRARHADEPDVALRVARTVYEIPLSTIVSAVARGHSVEVCLTDGRALQCAMSFAEVEAALGVDPRFLVCTRGVAVNMDHVSSLKDGVFVMRDGSCWPLRVRGQAKVIQEFTQYQISRMRRG